MPPIQSDIEDLLNGEADVAELVGNFTPGEIGRALASKADVEAGVLTKALYAVADHYIDIHEFEKGTLLIDAFISGGQARPGVMGEAWLLGSEFHGYSNRFAEALRHIENAKGLFRDTGDDEKLLRVHTDAAYFLIRLGDFGRARDQAAEGLVLAEKGEYTKWRMRLLTNLGLALKEIGDEHAAIDAFRKSVDLAKQLDSPRVIAVNLVNIGNLYGRLGRIEQAIEFMNRAKEAWAEIEDKREVARCLNNLANLVLETDRTQAMAYLTECLNISAEGKFYDVESAARHNVGLIHKAESRIDDAKMEFELCRQVSIDIGDDDGLWRADQQLGRLALEEGNAEKSRSILGNAVEVLTNMRKGLASDYDRIRFLADRESLFADLISADLAVADTLGALADIQRVKGIALFELMTGEQAPSINKNALKEIALHLGRRKMVAIDYFLLPDALVAGVLSANGISVNKFPLDIGGLKEALAGLKDRIKTYEISPELRSKPVRKDPAFEELLGKISGMILGVIKEPLDGAGHIVIIPYGILGQVPFAALKSAGTYLVERVPVSIFPNLQAVRMFLSNMDVDLKGYSLAFVRGDSSDLEALDAEAKAVKEGFPGKVSEVPVSGLESLTDAGGDWLHYSGHATFARDTGPEPFIETGDGRKIPFAMPGGKVPDVAVLSACQTGLGEMPGAGEMLGFARSMFAAGGKSMVATLWQVDDKGTRELMADFYAGLSSGKSVADTLAGAQRKAVTKGWHPYFWAGFICNGDLFFS